jgi:SET domain-containing protein
VGRNGGIVIVTLRRIEPGEEITYDDACRRKRAAKRRAKQKAAAPKRS